MAVETFDLDEGWLQEVLPDGLPVGTTTVVSGPGGSGKPLIGFAVVKAWLESGGSVVFLLTNSGRDFVDETMAELYDFDVDAYPEQLAFVDFDPTLEASVDGMVREDLIEANLLEPAVWDEALSTAIDRVDHGRTLVFASALNLFLFSPSYGDASLDTFVDTARGDDDHTYLFTVSTSAFEEQIARVEDASDTVLLTEMREKRLYLRGERSDSVSVSTDDVQVPFTSEQLETIKSVSEETRTSLIPALKES
ncbi:MAG: RAD55 family ATPase [Halapricum sp.]